MKLPLATIGGMAALACVAHGASYALSSIGKSEIVGSTSSVPTSGSPDNFSSGPIILGSTSATFQLVVSGTTDRYADLRVTITGVVGTLATSGGKSGVMVAQTSDSQGLTDAGTLSILTGFSTAGAGGITSMSFRFDFFEPDTSTPMPVALELTTFDLDYRQFMSVGNDDFLTSAHGSRVTRTSSGGVTKFSDDGNTDSAFTDSRNAVVLNNVPDASFEITVGKVGTGNSLFMFEFRDPSEILDNPLTPNQPVPEPSSLSLLAGAGALLLRRRRGEGRKA